MTILAALVSLSLLLLAMTMIVRTLKANGGAVLAALVNQPTSYLPPAVERRRDGRATPRVTGLRPVLRAAA